VSRGQLGQVGQAGFYRFQACSDCENRHLYKPDKRQAGVACPSLSECKKPTRNNLNAAITTASELSDLPDKCEPTKPSNPI
jgi:hypothetical protein